MNQQDERLEKPPLDDRLKRLAIKAQQCAKGSSERRCILTELLSVMQRSDKLCRPRREQFQTLYQEIYADALQRLFLFICERIDDYNPQKGEVLQWANFLLSKRFFIEASREALPTVYKGMDAKTVKRLSLEDLDRNHPCELNPQMIPSLSQEVKDCVAEDPEGLFEQTHIKENPEANFQYLALKRLDGYAWQDLSTELDIPVATLSCFYQRCLTKFAPKLKTYLS